METIIESIAKGGARPPPPPGSLIGAAARTAAPIPIALPLSGLSAAEAAAERAMRHASSFMDCESVLMHASLAGPKPTAAPMQVLSEAGSQRGRDLLQGHKLTAIQEDEDEIAQVGGGDAVVQLCGCWLLAVGCRLLAVGCRLSAAAFSRGRGLGCALALWFQCW